MEEAIEQIRFHGGLKLEGHKDESTKSGIIDCPAADNYVVPLQQHIGKIANPVVAVGDQVYKGQKIAEQNSVFSASAHSPVSGTVIDIGMYPAPHPSGLDSTCIVIENDHQYEMQRKEVVGDFYTVMSSHDLRELIRDAGIVGLGGAGFPTAIKQTEIGIHTLILNGVECEPYITCDDALMREHAREIIAGAEIIAHVVKARECIIAIEDNKPEAITAMQAIVDEDGTGFFHIEVVETIYPSGGERQLIQIITGKEVPINGFPTDIDVLCHNVATAYAIHNVIYHDEPLISRIVTVTGPGVEEPCNLRVPIGTPMSTCIEAAGGYNGRATSLIMGGPMMGFTLKDDQAPVSKACNCLLVDDIEVTPPEQMPCIRCGHCVDVCPARLLPQQLYWYASTHNTERLQQHRLFDCIECGCCSYVCPSKIPLVQYYRAAKSEIKQNRFSTNDSDRARQRHENRTERLERLKREREEKLAKKREALKNKKDGGDKQKAIADALARVAARKKNQSDGGGD